ncbi:MAG TPA: hypothetical protein VHC22_15490 [Pirellulales bacterium]|nr:hypothetical protein [Pirellulales bacterium]
MTDPITLELCPAVETQRQAAAWFIAGDEPGSWLGELMRWKVPLADVRLYIVPRSAADRRPCGVLAVPTTAGPSAETPCAAGYGRHSPRLYLPVDARFDPPASESEIDTELSSHLAVWHPAAGLVGYDEADVLSVADLIAPPTERACAWDRAQPGDTVFPRLVAVVPPAPAGPGQLILDLRDDIGSQAGEELPPAPDEPRESSLGAAASASQQLLAKALLKLTALVPRTASAPTWIDRVEEWAKRRLAGLHGDLESARHREINRLLHLLDTDPDEGLRYALPLGHGGHRGRGAPGSKLGTHDLDFRLDRLGGGGPADHWHVGQKEQIALQRCYRALAEREMQLGRHRRAAYIFAELLGDLPAAADALEQGGHDREAAVLYRDRLSRPLDAARCLERCGGWDEAIAIYTSQNAFERAADLLVRLERPDEARTMYRRAIEHWTLAGERLRAAKLLEGKLGAGGEAAILLGAGWPAERQAGACLNELFALFGRLVRHDEAGRWISRLRDELLSPAEAGEAVGVLARVAQRYADATIRHAAADVTRVLVGRRLPTSTANEAISLVQAVRSLVPQDDLLGRDAARWLARRSEPPQVRRAVKYGAPQQHVSIDKTHHFCLPKGVTYTTVVSVPGGLIAAGYSSDGVTVARSDFTGQTKRTDWRIPLASPRPLLLVRGNTDWPTLVALIAGPPLQGTLGIGTPNWFSTETLAATVSSLGVWWAIEDDLMLTSMRHDGTVLGRRPLFLEEIGVRHEPQGESTERSAVMLAHRDVVYLGLGRTLVRVKSERIDQTPLLGSIRRLVAAPLVVQLRLAAGFEDYGAAVIWDDLNGRDVLEVAHSLLRPELTFTLDGQLVAADANEGRVYSTSNRTVSLRGRFAGSRESLAGLVPGEHPGEFWLVSAGGETTGYRIA